MRDAQLHNHVLFDDRKHFPIETYDGIPPEKLKEVWLSLMRDKNGVVLAPEEVLARLQKDVRAPASDMDNILIRVFEELEPVDKPQYSVLYWIDNSAFYLFCYFSKEKCFVEALDSKTSEHGIGKKVMRNVILLAHDLGLSGVELSSSKDGAYVWPRMGFEKPAYAVTEEHFTETVANILHDHARRLEAYPAKPAHIADSEAAKNAGDYILSLVRNFPADPRLIAKIAAVPEVILNEFGGEEKLGHALLYAYGLQLEFPLNEGLKTERRLRLMTRYVEKEATKTL